MDAPVQFRAVDLETVLVVAERFRRSLRARTPRRLAEEEDVVRVAVGDGPVWFERRGLRAARVVGADEGGHGVAELVTRGGPRSAVSHACARITRIASKSTLPAGDEGAHAGEPERLELRSRSRSISHAVAADVDPAEEGDVPGHADNVSALHCDGFHPQYDELRTVFNVMIDKRPAVIAQCASPGDVRDALAHAANESLEVAVRAGGHSVAGVSVNDGGLVVDVRPMKDIAVDPAARTVKVGAGVNLGEFDAATQEHGLATTGGRVTTTGVGGTHARRRIGLARAPLRAHVRQPRVGRPRHRRRPEVTASAIENPELFWALHGGGGNFGVATAFEFAAPPGRPGRDGGAHDLARRRGTTTSRVSTATSCSTCPTSSGPAWYVSPGHRSRSSPSISRAARSWVSRCLWTGDEARGTTSSSRGATCHPRSTSSAGCPTRPSTACSTTHRATRTTGRPTTMTTSPTTRSTCS